MDTGTEILQKTRHATSKGDALIKLNMYDEALDSSNKSLAINSYSGYAWYVKGMALRGLNLDSDAEKAFDMSRNLGYTISYI